MFRISLTVLFMVFSFLSCTSKKSINMSEAKTYAFRLKPGEDLKKSIQAFVVANKIEAGWMATGVGSLTNYSIRFANQPNASTGRGHFEIVSLVGTLSTNGSHLHISLSDSSGGTIGGHLQEGCIIYTTAEIVVQSSSEFVFKRAKDGTTPWDELQVENR